MIKERLLKILHLPHVSEKAAILADKNRQFVFKVLSDAKKPEIKQAVEVMFNVKVKAVRILNTKGKTRVFKRVQGRLSNIKKAYVTLQEGYEINFGAGN